MTELWNNPLNIAHLHQRRAESLVKIGKYDEAIEQHVAAEKALQRVPTASVSAVVKDSLNQQREYHIRQQAIVRYKQKYAEKKKEQLRNKKNIQDHIFPSDMEQELKLNYIHQQTLQSICNHNLLVDSLIQSSQESSSLEDSTTLSRSLEDFRSLSRSLDCIPREEKKEGQSVIVDKKKLNKVRSTGEELRKVVCTLTTEFDNLRTENKVLRATAEEIIMHHRDCVMSQPEEPESATDVAKMPFTILEKMQNLYDYKGKLT